MYNILATNVTLAPGSSWEIVSAMPHGYESLISPMCAQKIFYLSLISDRVK